MGKRFCAIGATVGLLLAAATSLPAQQILTLTNGDRLTGQLVAVADGAWTFKHAGGDVKIPAADIASFTASSPIGVRLSDGTIAAASVAPAGNQLRLSLQDGTTRTVAPGTFAAVGAPTALDALVPVEIGFFSPFSQFWGAVVGLGFSDKSGNSRSRGVGANVEVARRSPKDRLTLRAGLAREDSRVGADDDLQRIVEKYYGSLRADVFVSPKLFVFGETRQERDKFQDIDLRSLYNAGFGYQILSTPVTDLRVYASGGARREDFTSDIDTKTAAVLGIGSGLRRDLGLAVLGWNVDWGPNVEDFEDYRLRSDASLTTTIFQGLGFRLGVLNELNNKPSAGFKKHDMLVTTSLTYTIGS